MCPGYVRIKLPLAEAMRRFSEWLHKPELASPVMVSESEAFALVVVDNSWRGQAFFIYECNGWTIFQDMTGALQVRDETDWLRLAEDSELVFAAYNDAIGYGEIVAVREGKLVRVFCDAVQEASHNKNRGWLPFEAQTPLTNWVDVASFVDDDELSYEPDTALLWIFERA